MIWIIIAIVAVVAVLILKKAGADQKQFINVPFRVKFKTLISHFSEGYFYNNCDIIEPLPSEVRLVGNGVNSNKMVRMFYSANVLHFDIRMKLYQVEYKKKYRLKDPLKSSDEALKEFGDYVAMDFGIYLQSNAPQGDQIIKELLNSQK